MKKVLFVLLGSSILLSACSGSKNIPLEKAPALKIIDPFWFKVMPGQEDGKKFNVLLLPIEAEVASCRPDSVYFQGYHEALQLSGYQDKTVYRAQMFEGTKPAEYNPPIEIGADQAIVSYLTPENEKKYFRVDQIVQGETIFMP